MSPAVEAHLAGARQARELAADCLEDAKSAAPARAFYLIAEHDRHIERAETYEAIAAMFAPKIKLEIAA